jgi:hypothetical protein
MAFTSFLRVESKNAILSQLSLDESADLRRQLHPVELVVRQGLYEPNQPIEYLTFPNPEWFRS